HLCYKLLYICLFAYKFIYLFNLCFFFQAEDGIRVFHVTGVQTCALPIYRRPLMVVIAGAAVLVLLAIASGVVSANLFQGPLPERSEERRVGKGWISHVGSDQ